ncbi:CHAT domain-containing protein [Verrucosispora sp. WMMA2044]|uniref:CHAT domain-containing protein n=1 Tax=Verrucosispora sp. WMMA2044 TaxID=3016419 RepID=UPI00248D044D|nr:CHAT domain-containing protein [Verrucosispora sp. WMMA2044]WBB50005.1 CHAT domain-containing protein [Verrucosispora sp. WMMA2044]
MWRRFRSDPVQRLRERLDSFGTTMEPRWVLDHEALMEARPLYDLLDGVSRRGASEREAEALFLLACLHWYRYQCLPAGSDGPDLVQAVGLTELLLSLAPERVPPSLLAMLRAHVSAGPGRDVGSGASARADPRPGSGIGASGAGAANTAGSGPSGSARSGTPPPGVRVPAARSTPEAELGAALFGQAVMLMAGAERSGDYRVADQAQALLERALVGTPSGAPERLHYLSALGRVHREQYLRLGRQRSLPAAIDAHRESLESTPAGDPERPTRLFNLGNVLGDRFEQAGDVAALDESIQLLGDAARAAPADAPVWLMARVNLAGQLRERWERRGEPADLDRAVDVLAQAVSVRADPLVLFTYATLASRRFVASGTDGDLDTAIEANRAALASGLSEEQGGLARVTLAGLVGERHERRKTPADLDAAIEAYRVAAAGPRLDGQDAGGLWQAEGKLLEARYALHRRADDLREAERLLRAAVDGTTDPEQRARVLCDLGYTLGRWHADLFGLATLRQAREVLTEAERLLPADHPSRPDLLNNLGDTLRDLADQAGEPELLELAVTKLREAAANPANPAKLPLYLSNLGLALQELFGRTQDLAILTEAMVVLRRAVAAAPPGNPDRMWGLFNLGSALNRRTELVVNAALPTDGATPEQARAAALTDAEQAVTLLREAAELAQREAEPEERVRIVRTLALSHLLRHQLTEDPAVLDEAVTLLRALADAAAASAGDRYRLLTNLGNALLIRFRTRRNAPDAREMLTAYRAAVAALPVDHPERTMCLSNLAVAVEEITHSTADATAPADATAQPAPDGPAPDGPAATGHSADSTAVVSAVGGDLPPVDLAEAIGALREAAAIEAAPSLLRAVAARRYAALAAEAGDLPAALAGYTTAIELLDLVAWHGMDLDDQGRLLGQFPGLAGDAAAVAIALDRPQRAVELLEYGRGVLLTRAHDAGADLAALRARAPHLAERLAATQAALDRLVPVAGPTGPAPLGGPTAAVLAVAVRPADDEPGVGSERRHELAVQRREVLAEIRQLPDFGRFLRPPPFADLARAGEDGPVVLVNVADRRCDALLVSGGRVTTVPLPELSLGELQVRAAYFLTGLAEVTAPVGDPGPEAQRRRAAFRRRIPETLDWLWRVVAAPVLDALDPPAAPPDAGAAPARLWWCPTGVLALLPLHAAAPSGGGSGVLDRVVPSYTASLRALIRARRGPASSSAPVTSALVVGMPRTPGLADLPGAAGEEAVVRRYVTDVTTLTGPSATASAVLDALPGTPVVHLSCHGTQDLAAPARGRLALAGGPLHVRDLWRPADTTAALAVLSACDTVRGGAALPDEALTLGTAFQLAGFRHVIGALWAISDTLTVQLCEDLYAALAVPGGLDPERAASALHHAVRQVRAALPDLPELWAGYVHVGP